MRPIFVKGHLSFSVDDKRREFVHQNISIYGVNGLPWGTLDRVNDFGREIQVDVRIPGDDPIVFQTTATISREESLGSSQMGLKFLLDPSIQTRLEARIAKYGIYPTEYVRKYPRIPANELIQTYPLRALVTANKEENPSLTDMPLIFDVSNLSPNGVLLKTENQAALIFVPGDRIKMTLEPRGWFPVAVKVDGLICRLTDQVSVGSLNLVRYVGVKFTNVDEENRTAFLDLLKDILERLKMSGT